jgi:hypothetical protein
MEHGFSARQLCASPFGRDTGQPYDPTIGKDWVRCGGDNADTLAPRQVAIFGGGWKETRHSHADATKPKARHRH